MDQLKSSIVQGDGAEAVKQLKLLLSEGYDAQVLLDAMIDSLRGVGEAFSKGEAYIPEMLKAAHAMQQGVGHLGPFLVTQGGKKIGKFMIATVAGDMHDVGKNLVALVLRGNGFEVVDLGVDVSFNKLIDAYGQEQPDILGLSALLTTTMPAMEKAVNEIKRAHPEAQIMVGGAPITSEFAAQIGADRYAPDAGAAAKTALQLLNKKSSNPN
jgi:methanogenic corrinoid protein MtbC1